MGSAQSDLATCGRRQCYRCEVRRRLNYGIKSFTPIVDYWQQLSDTYCDVFFSPPLTVATEILQTLKVIVMLIQNASQESPPNFHSLMVLSYFITKKQCRQYNQMGRAADLYLKRFDGFKADTLIKLFREWNKIEEEGLNSVGLEDQNYKYLSPNIHHEHFMKLFRVLIIHPLDNLDYEMDEIFLWNTSYIKNSTFELEHEEPQYSSAVPSGNSSDHDEYLPLEQGEFAMFRSKWASLIRRGSSIYPVTVNRLLSRAGLGGWHEEHEVDDRNIEKWWNTRCDSYSDNERKLPIQNYNEVNSYELEADRESILHRNGEDDETELDNSSDEDERPNRAPTSSEDEDDWKDESENAKILFRRYEDEGEVRSSSGEIKKHYWLFMILFILVVVLLNPDLIFNSLSSPW